MSFQLIIIRVCNNTKSQTTKLHDNIIVSYLLGFIKSRYEKYKILLYEITALDQLFVHNFIYGVIVIVIVTVYKAHPQIKPSPYLGKLSKRPLTKPPASIIHNF